MIKCPAQLEPPTQAAKALLFICLKWWSSLNNWKLLL